ncbi:MAG: hypothetical protein AAGJ93_08680 [Bacteroidota bacterium]
MKKRLLLLFFIAIVYIVGNLVLNRWTKSLYYGDSNGYYLHVVSFFVNQDVGDYDKTITSLIETNPNSLDPREDIYGIRLTEKGRRYIKYTLGVPVMETPFFLLAHAYAKVSGKYKADGWSTPYLFIVGFAIIFYVLIGFYLLIGVLERYFSTTITVLTVLAVAFATNIFFQSTYVTMSHGFLFFDYCLLLHLTLRFYDNPSALKAFGIGAVVGLITLTRVPEVVSAFIPLLWGVYDKKTLLARWQLIKENGAFVLAAPIGFILVFSLQISYWYYVSGEFFFNPYQGEGFDFMNPRIHKGWFDFKNGWLIYTPIMAFSLLGWFLLRKHNPASQLAIFVFVGLHAYIHYSYYAWSYFPGLGQRPMVETYPLLSFGLAAFFLSCNKSVWLRWVPAIAIIFFTGLNMFQTWQMKKGVIWSERSNQAFYWETFGTLTPTLNSLRSYDSGEFQPKEEEIKRKEKLYEESFEDTTALVTSTAFPRSGSHTLYDSSKLPYTSDTISLSGLSPGDWIKVGVHAFIEGKDFTYNRDVSTELAIQLYDEWGYKYRGRRIKIAGHIANPGYSIWSAGEPRKWGEASFYIGLPAAFNDRWQVLVRIYNNHEQLMHLDDLYIESYERQ